MRKLKKALSLSLVLALSLAMAVPAFAAGTTETVNNVGGRPLRVTITNVVKVVTDTYGFEGMYISDDEYTITPEKITIYVISDEGADLTLTYLGDPSELYKELGRSHRHFWNAKTMCFENEFPFDGGEPAKDVTHTESFGSYKEAVAGWADDWFTDGSPNYRPNMSEYGGYYTYLGDGSSERTYGVFVMYESDFAQITPHSPQSPASRPPRPSRRHLLSPPSRSSRPLPLTPPPRLRLSLPTLPVLTP